MPERRPQRRKAPPHPAPARPAHAAHTALPAKDPREGAPAAEQTPVTETLWQVTVHGDHRLEPGQPYYFENAPRQPAGLVVIQYTKEGQVLFEDRGQQRILVPGWAMIFLYGEDSIYGKPEGYTGAYACEWIHVAGAGAAQHYRLLCQRFGSSFFWGPEHPLLEAFQDLGRRSRPRTLLEAIQAAELQYRFYLRLYAWLEELRAHQLRPVDRAVEELLRQPHRPWSLKEVATRNGCSREHLTRAFSARLGRSPAQYLAQVRLRRAQELIRETSLPLGAIAEQAGFASKHTMARHIRQATGQAPSAGRQAAQPPAGILDPPRPATPWPKDPKRSPGRRTRSTSPDRKGEA